MKAATVLLVSAFAALVVAAPAAADHSVDVCVEYPSPDPKGAREECYATADGPHVPPICYYDPHPPHQTCIA